MKVDEQKLPVAAILSHNKKHLWPSKYGTGGRHLSGKANIEEKKAFIVIISYSIQQEQLCSGTIGDPTLTAPNREAIAMSSA